MGCVYLVKHKNVGPVKIGYSSAPTPTKRLGTMGTYSPYGIEIIGWFSHPKAAAIEKQLHEKYAPFRLHGEWFNITTEQAKAIVHSYDDTFFDRAQRALLSLEEPDSGDDVNRIKHSLHGKTMPKYKFIRHISSIITAGDWNAAKKWINDNLKGKYWYHEHKQKAGGRGRKGMVVRIGGVEEWQE